MSKFVPEASLDALSAMLEDMDSKAYGENKGVDVPFAQVGRSMTQTGTLERRQTTLLGGPPGNGKTFAALHLVVQAVIQKMRVLYLPFEMTGGEILQRAYAILAGSWDVLSGDKEKILKYYNAAMQDGFLRDNLQELSRSIAGNPLLPRVDGDSIFVADAYAESVADWFTQNGMNYDLVVIDPISMLNYTSGGRQEWQGQQDFMRRMPGIARLHKCHLVLIAHTGKRQTYKGKHIPISMDSVMGSAALTRFVDNILLLDFCRDGHRTSTVREISGLRMEVDHKRTLIIEKSRTAGGTGAQFACDFAEGGPDFDVHGLIVPEE